MNKLVAYFSVGGSTAAIARELAEGIGADLFEIRPAVPYTKEDLNFKNPKSRVTKEKFGRKEVAIADRVDDMDKYDEVFIGFPVWYAGAPNIISSFVKSYDLSGKRIALFATSGGSDVARVPARIQKLTGGKVYGAKRFEKGESRESVTAWAEMMEQSEITAAEMDVLRAAQQGEIDAVLMYNELAKVVKDPKHAEVFRQLAAEEGGHAAVFRAYTKENLRPDKTKSIVVPLMYRTLGPRRVYPIIAKAEYDAMKKYISVAERFPEVESVKMDEKRHGDIVTGLIR